MNAKRLALVLAAVLLGVVTYQPLTRGYVYSQIGSLFTWSGSAQAWSGSTQVLSCSDWNSYIKNDGTACPTSMTVLDSYALAHAVNQVTHAPLVANNTFSSGALSPWTSTNSGSCNGYTFTVASSPDEDGDSAFVNGSSAQCSSTPAVVNLTQTFSTSGAPTAQTYSFWYNAPTAKSGDSRCTQTAGIVALVAAINGTNLPAITVTQDGKWHQVSGTTALMGSGSNTFKVTATLTAATGFQFLAIQRACSGVVMAGTQTISIDNVVLSGIY